MNFFLCVLFFRLIIKLPLYNKIRSLKRKLKTAESKLDKLNKKRKQTKLKQTQAKKKRPNNKETRNVTVTTPEKNAHVLMQSNNLSPQHYSEITQELVAYNTLAKQVSEAPKSVKKSLLQKHNTKQTARCAQRLAKKIGLHRQNVLNAVRRRSSFRGKILHKKTTSSSVPEKA